MNNELTVEQEKIFIDNMNLVYHIAKRYKDNNYIFDKEDIYNIGFVGYTKGIKTYNISKGKISTYLCKCIDNAYLAEIRYNKRSKRKNDDFVLSFDYEYNNDGSSEDTIATLHDMVANKSNLSNDVTNKLLYESIIQYVEDTCKNEKYKKCFYMYFKSNMTKIQISEELGMSRTMVYNVIHDLLNKIKNEFGELNIYK